MMFRPYDTPTMGVVGMAALVLGLSGPALAATQGAQSYDLNGDGKADLVWRDKNNGTVAVWLMNGTTIASVGFPADVSLDWEIEQVADVNGDGKADLVWQHTNGQVAVWLMNGAVIESVAFPASVPSEWEIQPSSGRGDGNPTLRWDQVLPAAERFVMVMGDAAVLDKETGLVWEQAPLTTTHTWQNARLQCTSRTTGGRKGWRLPSVHELASLVDPSVAFPGLTLPSGHPFTDVQPAFYWSATTTAADPANAWDVVFSGSNVTFLNKANTFHVWCVRGGMNADQY
jgi:hypothetical protein